MADLYVHVHTDTDHVDSGSASDGFSPTQQSNTFFSGILKNKVNIYQQQFENKLKDYTQQTNTKKTTTLQQKIDKKRTKLQSKLQSLHNNDDDGNGDNCDNNGNDDDNNNNNNNNNDNDNIDDKKQKQQEHRYKKFNELGVIKPLLKSMDEMGYEHATRIQELSIPLILQGKDILGRSVTGSGKTAAFLVPILQKIYLEKQQYQSYIKAIIIIPTRELAVQCYNMFTDYNRYTRLTGCLIIGSTSIQKQEKELEKRPDVLICTPGRILDLVKNSKNIELENIEYLVLDEADKLLELGFEVEIAELVKQINIERQTMLYSATLNEKVEAISSESLKKPVKVLADGDRQTSRQLRQEVFKIRDGDSCFREGCLLYLVTKVYKNKGIIFFRTKKQCHRMAIIFGLLGIKGTELQGDMKQCDRIEALSKFRKGEYDYLLATDLASRGLDIKELDVVINFEIPVEVNRYIHRVGRTARAGKQGASITIVDDTELKKLKKIMKQSGDKLYSRKYKDKDIRDQIKQVDKVETSYWDIIKMERTEKELEVAQLEMKKAQNMIEHQDEIANRPRREWVQTKQQKQQQLKKQMQQLGLDKDKDQLNTVKKKVKK